MYLASIYYLDQSDYYAQISTFALADLYNFTLHFILEMKFYFNVYNAPIK